MSDRSSAARATSSSWSASSTTSPPGTTAARGSPPVSACRPRTSRTFRARPDNLGTRHASVARSATTAGAWRNPAKRHFRQTRRRDLGIVRAVAWRGPTVRPLPHAGVDNGRHQQAPGPIRTLRFRVCLPCWRRPTTLWSPRRDQSCQRLVERRSTQRLHTWL